MIELSIVENGYAAVSVVRKKSHIAAIVLAQPLKITVRHFLRHGPTIEVFGDYHYDVRNRLTRVVERAH